MNLEVGMYVRTKDSIVKIEKILDGVMWDTLGHVHFGDFIKASHTLLGNDEEPCLIEVGDYVNGLLVHGITDYGLQVYMFGDCKEILEEHEIKSIVTKEQFEHSSYKIS